MMSPDRSRVFVSTSGRNEVGNNNGQPKLCSRSMDNNGKYSLNDDCDERIVVNRVQNHRTNRL